MTTEDLFKYNKEEEEEILRKAGCRDLIELMKCQNCSNCFREGNEYFCREKENKRVKLIDTCSFWNERIEPMEQEKLRGIYEKIKIVLKEYIDMREEYYSLIALWIMGTWFHKEFETFPYLFINAMRGAAKTRTLKLIASLEKEGEYLASLTEAVLFRQNNPLGIDEFENVGSRDKQALRELLNSAYKKGIKVKRMKKVKTKEGESQQVETFELYRPIHMANIWGMEEVLGDRCITIFLEKSSNKGVTKLMENFEEFPLIKDIKTLLNELSVVLCSVVMPRGVYIGWHNYIKLKYTLNYTIHITTYNNTKLQTFFESIDNADIEGRNLELFFPLFILADRIGEDVLKEIIEIAKVIVEERKVEEVTESKDVMMFEFISNQASREWYKVKELTTLFRTFIHDDEQDNPWLNSKWVGRALRRLQLIGKKRRTGEGVEVILNIEKAKEKMLIFRPIQNDILPYPKG